ncbi:MAG TPA: 5'-nucleotidase C-terminal domain-containing protein, partial [Labilithrix sp.]
SLRYAWSATTGVDATSITIAGAPLDDVATYRVTVSSYLAGGGDGFTVFTKGKNLVTTATDIDAFVAYLTAHDPLTPQMPSRITKE